jgi:hypothetical protein
VVKGKEIFPRYPHEVFSFSHSGAAERRNGRLEKKKRKQNTNLKDIKKFQDELSRIRMNEYELYYSNFLSIRCVHYGN